jgi:hypothetical protein
MLNRHLIVDTLPNSRFFQSSVWQASATEQHVAALKRMIWLYFWLLIFEGALRKWVPSLSTLLLVVRDPLVLLIYFQAARCRHFPVNAHVLVYFSLVISFILLALVQIMAGIGGGPLVAAYGLRTNFLHLPLIFVIPKVFSYSDVVKLGKWVLILSIPMAALMVLQFLSPPDSWINAATMVDVKQIDFVAGKIRPAGVFSFATGAAHFFVLATTFLIYGLAEKGATYSRWLVWAALFSVAIVQPVSGSRTLVLGCALEMVAAIVFGILNPRRAYRIFAIAILICAAAAALSLTSFFREAVTAFMTRWDDASTASGGIEEGLVWRFFGAFLEPLVLLPAAGLIGRGLGVGTGAGATLMTGAPQFLLAENEWPRVVLESGPLLGFSFLAYRVWVAGSIALRAARSARLEQLLPWLLAWYACRSLVTESISQPTNLGFMVFVSGLCLAAIPGTDSARAPDLKWRNIVS